MTATILADIGSGVEAILTDFVQGPSGSISSPTGTGFVHVTAGAIDGAARAVNLASSGAGGDVTGILAIANGGTGLSSVGTTGFVLTSTGSAAAWAAASSVAIVQLSGDVVAGPGVGNVPATVVKINGASVPAAGALTTGNVLQVTGASSLGYAPVNLAGGANFVTGALPVANLGHGTTAQLLVTNSVATPAWVSMSQDVTITSTGVATVASIHGATVPAAGALTTGNGLYVSGSSALTYSALNLAGGSGWVTGVLPSSNLPSLAGDASGPISAAVVTSAQSGLLTFTASTGNIALTAAATAPGVSQATAGSGVTPVNLTITPQAPNAGSTTLASNTGGSLNVALASPGVAGTAGTEAAFTVSRGGATYVSMGALPGFGSSYAHLTLGPALGAVTSANATIQATSGLNALNYPSNSGAVALLLGGNYALRVNGPTAEVSSAAGFNFGVNTITGSFGGGVGVLALANATTQPTTAPSGVVLSSNGGNLSLYDSNGFSTTIGSGDFTCNRNMTFEPVAVSVSGGKSLSLNAGDSSANGSQGGLLTIRAGNETGTTSTGGAASFSGGSGTSTGGNASLISGAGATTGVLLLSSGQGTVYGGLGVVSSGNTPGGIVFRGAGLTQTQLTAGGGKATLTVAGASFLFAPCTYNGVTAQIVLCV